MGVIIALVGLAIVLELFAINATLQEIKAALRQTEGKCIE